jgi:hypothetical protein
MVAATDNTFASVDISSGTNRALDATLYVVWALFWLLMILIAVQDTALDAETSWWEPVVWEGSSCLFATIWMVIQRRAGERYDVYLDRPGRWIAQHLKWLPLIIATFLVCVYLVRHGIYALAGREYRHDPWAYVIVYETVKIGLFFGLWLGIFFGFSSYHRWQEERRQLVLLQKSLADAQLSQLKAQLRPHLFFNVLNTISALMHIDVERADRLLARLGDLLRTTLQSGDRDVTSLGEELRLLKLYADVMQERFADRVSLEWHVQEGNEIAAIPALLLQPFLENAFKHGVEVSREHVRIDVAVRRQGDRLLLCIRNSGGRLESSLGGIGVRNSRERLRMLFGDQTSIELSQQGEYVEARIQLPWRRSVE